jgi:hypothetical protein
VQRCARRQQRLLTLAHIDSLVQVPLPVHLVLMHVAVPVPPTRGALHIEIMSGQCTHTNTRTALPALGGLAQVQCVAIISQALRSPLHSMH